MATTQEIIIPLSNDQSSNPSSFLLLPTEIKVLIVEMIFQQDVRFLDPHDGKRTALPEDLEHNFGNSNDSIFFVNKEMSELAAAHMFMVGILTVKL